MMVVKYCFLGEYCVKEGKVPLWNKPKRKFQLFIPQCVFCESHETLIRMAWSSQDLTGVYWGIHADVIVYIFAHFHITHTYGYTYGFAYRNKHVRYELTPRS